MYDMKKASIELLNLKGKRSSDGNTLAECKWTLPVIYHLCDVATVGAYLWDEWISDDVKKTLTDVLPNTRSIFLLACYIHDIGKFSTDFQRTLNVEKSDDIKDHVTLTDSFLRISVGHLRDLKSNLVREMVSYHHGIHSDNSIDPVPKNHYLCFDEVCSFIDDVLAELKLDKSVFLMPRTVLPFHKRIILSGLLIIADWLGSNQRLFHLLPNDKPVDTTKYEYRQKRARALLRKIFPFCKARKFHHNIEEYFNKVFGENFVPTPLQHAVMKNAKLDLNKHRLVFIEAPTGHGKTEAALSLAYRYIAECDDLKNKGIYIAMPTRATSNGLYDRVTDFIHKAFHGIGNLKLYHSKAPLFLSDKVSDKEINKTLVSAEQTANKVNSHDNGSNNEDLSEYVLDGKLSHAHKFLLGTVDHVLTMCLNTKHFTMLHTLLMNHVFVFDEVHCYDPIMLSCLRASLTLLSLCDVPVIILSATMPRAKRKALMEAYGIDKSICLNAYPKNEKDKTVDEENVIRVPGGREESKFVTFDLSLQTVYQLPTDHNADAEAIAEKIKELGQRGYYGVIVNTVKRAQDIYETLNSKDNFQGDVILLHSRFEAEHRNDIEKKVIADLGKQGFPKRNSEDYFKIVISTQIVEQSIDIDFDVMFSDLCPMDALLQRTGRLHRHAQNDAYRPDALKTPTCYVMQAYKTVEDDAKREIESSYLKHEANKDNLFYHVDSYSCKIYQPFLLYSTYLELKKFTSNPMNTVAETEVVVNEVYDENISDEKVLDGESLESSYKEMKRNIESMQGKACETMLKAYTTDEEFKKALDEGHLLCGGVNDVVKDVVVRDMTDTLEVVVMTRDGEKYVSCYNNDVIDVSNVLDMGRHTVALPARIVRKCGGIKELKKILKENRPDDVAEIYTPVIVFENGNSVLLNEKVLLTYDVELGLCDDYEIGQDDEYIRIE